MIRKITKSIILITTFLFTINLYAADDKDESKYQRIISLSPAVTEILFALNLDNNIIGVTTACDFPEKAKKKRAVGSMVNPSIEIIASLNPDIVFLSKNGTRKIVFNRLKSLNIQTFVYDAEAISNVAEEIRKISVFLGVEERGKNLAGKIEEKLKTFSLIHKRKKEKALFVIWASPLIVAGKNTLAGEALNIVGLENIAGNSNVSYPRFSIEEVIKRNPDIIFVGLGHNGRFLLPKALLNKLSSVNAVKRKRVIYISDKLYRAGPRIVEGVQEIADSLKEEK